MIKNYFILLLLSACSPALIPLEEEIAEDVVENVIEDISKRQLLSPKGESL